MPYLVTLQSNCANDVTNLNTIFDDVTQKEDICNWILKGAHMVLAKDVAKLKDIADSIYTRIMERCLSKTYDILCMHRDKKKPEIKFRITIQRYVAEMSTHIIDRNNYRAPRKKTDRYCYCDDFDDCRPTHEYWSRKSLDVTNTINADTINEWFHSIPGTEDMNLAECSQQLYKYILDKQYKLSNEDYFKYEFVQNGEKLVLDVKFTQRNVTRPEPV